MAITQLDKEVTRYIPVNGDELETVISFKYLRAMLETCAALARQKPRWRENNVTLKIDIRLLQDMVVANLL